MLDSIVVANDPCRGQRAWLQIGGGTTLCSRKMRETQLSNVGGPNGWKDAKKRYNTTAGEPDLASLRLEWSYMLGRTDTLHRRILKEAMPRMKGAVAELRHLQGA
jgi:hypothetical protein